jgi:hypothetical protein
VLGPYRTVFHLAIGLLLLVRLAAQFLPGREQALALQQERRAEMHATDVDRRDAAHVGEPI